MTVTTFAPPPTQGKLITDYLNELFHKLKNKCMSNNMISLLMTSFLFSDSTPMVAAIPPAPTSLPITAVALPLPPAQGKLFTDYLNVLFHKLKNKMHVN